MPELELVVDGNLSWGDYKKIVSDATPFDVRTSLIEKHITVRGVEGVTIDDVPVRQVLGALKKMLADANDPNA